MMKYTIKRHYANPFSFSPDGWRVYLGTKCVGAFLLKRTAIAWILRQEKKS
jgi:hypothetical protein